MNRAIPHALCRRPIAWIALAGALLNVAGCKRAKPSTGKTVAPPAIVLDTPEHAVRTLFTGLADMHKAIAASDDAAAAAIRRALHAAVAQRELVALINRYPRIKLAITEGMKAGPDEIVDGMVSNWASATSYYIEGVHLDRMYRTALPGGKPGRVAVVVPASGPKDDALIRVTCVRGKDGRWRILRVEFVVKAPPLPASTQPAGSMMPGRKNHTTPG